MTASKCLVCATAAYVLAWGISYTEPALPGHLICACLLGAALFIAIFAEGS